MTQKSVLLIHSNPREAAVASKSLAQVLMAMPMHVPTGEAAILWLSQNACDACVVDYRLSGINGVETLIRIHQRHPALPVVIVSDARSEDVAIAAFRAGAADYVPKDAGVYPAVAGILQRIFSSQPVAAPSAAVVPGTGTVPAELMRPTYQNRLRTIGRQLDLYSYRSATIVEVGGGFIASVASPGERNHQALEFPDEHLPHLIANTIAVRGEREHQRARSPLLPTGYEDFLRALGYRLDRYSAEVVSIAELSTVVAVGGMALEEGQRQGMLTQFEWLLRADEIEAMLDDAYRRRTQTQDKSSFMGRLLRGSSKPN